MLLVCAAGEIVIRAVVMDTRGGFVAYMLLTNWATVFLLGTYFGQRPLTPTPLPLRERGRGKGAPRPGRPAVLLGCVLGLVLLLTVWPALWNGLIVEPSFPFKLLGVGSWAANLAVTSAAVSAVYLFYTALTYGLARWLPDLAIVRFFSRNTLIIFIVHMPLFYLWSTFDLWAVPYRLARMPLRLVVCFLLPAVASELIYRVVRPKALRDKLRLLWLSPKPGHGLLNRQDAESAKRRREKEEKELPGVQSG
jgi:hypothetical protein